MLIRSTLLSREKGTPAMNEDMRPPERTVAVQPPVAALIPRLLRLLLAIAVLYGLLFASVRIAYDRGYSAGSHNAAIVSGTAAR
jgi:hypothetical protein